LISQSASKNKKEKQAKEKLVATEKAKDQLVGKKRTIGCLEKRRAG